jgi:hypothetical protein
LTIPSTVKNLDGAISFCNFILSTNGKNILKDQGLNPVKSIAEGDLERIPSPIRAIATKENPVALSSQVYNPDITKK